MPMILLTTAIAETINLFGPLRQTCTYLLNERIKIQFLRIAFLYNGSVCMIVSKTRYFLVSKRPTENQMMKNLTVPWSSPPNHFYIILAGRPF